MGDKLEKFVKYLGREKSVIVKYSKDGSYSVFYENSDIKAYFDNKGLLVRAVFDSTHYHEFVYDDNDVLVDVVDITNKIW